MELLANTGTTNTLGRCIRGPAIFLIPAAIHLIRSSTTGSGDARHGYFPLAPTGPPKAIADNAHRIAQGVLALRPATVLRWFCSAVLNLSDEVSENTVEYLKSRDTIWRMLDQQATNGTSAGAVTPETRGPSALEAVSDPPLPTLLDQETEISQSWHQEPAETLSASELHPYHKLTSQDMYGLYQPQIPALSAAKSYLNSAWIDNGSAPATSASFCEANRSYLSARDRFQKEHID